MSTHMISMAEAERLEMLAEEAAEIVKAVTKILRHGYLSYNPDAPQNGTNREQLAREIGDLRAIMLAMANEGDVVLCAPDELPTIWQRKLRYTHWQPGAGQPGGVS